MLPKFQLKIQMYYFFSEKINFSGHAEVGILNCLMRITSLNTGKRIQTLQGNDSQASQRVWSPAAAAAAATGTTCQGGRALSPHFPRGRERKRKEKKKNKKFGLAGFFPFSALAYGIYNSDRLSTAQLSSACMEGDKEMIKLIRRSSLTS